MDESLAPPLAQLTPVEALIAKPVPPVAPPAPVVPTAPTSMPPTPVATDVVPTEPAAPTPTQPPVVSAPPAEPTPAKPPTSTRAKFILFFFVAVAATLAAYVLMPSKSAESPTPTQQPAAEQTATQDSSTSATTPAKTEKSPAFCESDVLRVSVGKLSGDWSCETNALSPENGDAYMFLTSKDIGITISNVAGDDFGCREGYEAYCVSEPFFSNDIMETKLYKLSDKDKDIAGGLKNKAVNSIGAESPSQTVIVASKEAMENFTDAEKAALKEVFKQVSFMQK